MQLPILVLTSEAFAPYGKVIEMPGRDVDASGPGWKWWGENVLLDDDAGAYAVGYLDLQPANLTFDWAERHMRTLELLIPVGGDCLVYVGPPEHLEEPERLPPLVDFRVFRVRQGQGVLLNRGVWHGAPLALDRPLNVIVLLAHKTALEDTSMARFEEIEVAPGASVGTGPE